MPRRSAVRAVVLAVAGVALFAAGWWAHAVLGARTSGGQAADRRVHLGGFRLVSPLLDVELPEGYSVDREPLPFRPKLARYVDEQVRAGRVREMSVYYRDLLDGPWFAVNEQRKYDPASMMKVPVMIAWLKRAERDPRALEASFVFDASTYPGSGQVLEAGRTLSDGHRYTVEELLRYMLAYSDNRAMWLLFGALKAEELNDVLDSMDVTNDPDDTSNAMSVVGYSGFFRILFNASYLNREQSERALELLALQDFPEGLVAGVPRGVTVASKFGETAPAPGTGELQLHEFGIVYAPSGPYILGVMTVGRDRVVQAAVLREVSGLVFGEVAAQAGRRPMTRDRQVTR